METRSFVTDNWFAFEIQYLSFGNIFIAHTIKPLAARISAFDKTNDNNDKNDYDDDHHSGPVAHSPPNNSSFFYSPSIIHKNDTNFNVNSMIEYTASE